MMEKRFVALTIISLLFITSIATASNVVNQRISKYENRTTNDVTTIIADIYVDDADSSWYDETHGKTIKEGVNNASNGYTIFVPGELIVKFKEGVNIYNSNGGIGSTGINSIDLLNKGYGVKSADKLFKNTVISSLSNIYKLVLSENTDVLNAAEAYSKNSNIEYAEPNYIYRTCNIPNDPYFSYQWALNQSNDFDVDAPEAWDIETGNPDITIAIIDSGVDYLHPDLSANIWINDDEIIDGADSDLNAFVDDTIGWDFCNNDNDPLDDNGHGTHCAGIASAVTNNSEGIAGLCWNCKIMPLKIINESGVGTMEHGAAAILYAVDNGADVISMSFGNTIYSNLFDDVTEYAYNKGVFLVGAAGNNNNDRKHYPAAYDHVLAVAATDETDHRCDAGDWFIFSGSNYGDWVDISAPGNNIYSTMPTYNVSMNKHGYGKNYTEASGTSMACPYVAGLAGLLLSFDSNLNTSQLTSRIIYSADRLSPKEKIGRGRINAYEALIRGPGPAMSDISFPIHLTEVAETIDISGSASGEGFQYFILQYAKGKNPDEESWVEIINSTTEVQNDVLSPLDTTTLDEGIYLLRLKVVCDNGFYKDKIRIIVNNYHNTIYVDDDGGPGIDFTSIEEAVENCGTGDKIFVYNGTYIENIEIYKSITVIGENRETTVIKAKNDNLSCIYISSNKVNISGFTITNTSGIFTSAGILLEDTNNCDISYNNVYNNFVGIKLKKSCHNKIYKNNLTENWLGVRLIQISNFNKISYNNFNSILFGLFGEHASYFYSYFNRWNSNYWDDWLGVKIKLCRFIPYRIKFRFWDLSGLPLLHVPRLRCNFDWRPSAEPYDIPPTKPDTNIGGI